MASSGLGHLHQANSYCLCYNLYIYTLAMNSKDRYKIIKLRKIKEYPYKIVCLEKCYKLIKNVETMHYLI